MAKRSPLRLGFWWRGGKISTRDPVSGRQVATGFSDPQAAYLWHTERQRLAASPAYRAATEAKLGLWCRRVIATKKAERAAGTADMYSVKLGHIVRILGADTPMASISAAAVDHYVATRRAERVGSNTISRELTCLRQLLRYAERAGQYQLSPAAVMPIGFSVEYVPVTRTLALENLPLLLAALRNDQERVWVSLALALAADASDIHRMQPDDFDAARGLFHLRGTKNRARDAWLPVFEIGSESPVLRELAARFAFALPRLPVAPWPRASKGVGEAAARAGLPHLSPKDLRRTTITWLAEAGVEQAITSRFARHIGDQMVRKIYAQIAPRELGGLIERQVKHG